MQIHHQMSKKPTNTKKKFRAEVRIFLFASLSVTAIFCGIVSHFIVQQRAASNSELCRKLVAREKANTICDGYRVKAHKNSEFWTWVFTVPAIFPYFLMYFLLHEDMSPL
tara:strand:- start:588 stop:917 length:330 start_codon:yes stop_codon:yes gene_type:complete